MCASFVHFPTISPRYANTVACAETRSGSPDSLRTKFKAFILIIYRDKYNLFSSCRGSNRLREQGNYRIA